MANGQAHPSFPPATAIAHQRYLDGLLTRYGGLALPIGPTDDDALAEILSLERASSSFCTRLGVRIR